VGWNSPQPRILRCTAQIHCGHTHTNNRPTRDRFCCEKCCYEGHADVVGAINVSQGRILPVEPPKRIRKRVGKRKPVRASSMPLNSADGRGSPRGRKSHPRRGGRGGSPSLQRGEHVTAQ